MDLVSYCGKHGLGNPSIYREAPLSGMTETKPELEKILAALGEGDTLAVTEWSRITRRGIPELLNIARMVTGKGATLLETTSGCRYDNSAIGELMIALTATFDRMERERISARTKSGLAARRMAGVRLGRPKGKSKLDTMRADIVKYRKLKINQTDIARLLGVSRGALAAWLARHKV
jgi:DNA invertase Pin-like site-specific DNA recombinase